jgi:hypothetical protein
MSFYSSAIEKFTREEPSTDVLKKASQKRSDDLDENSKASAFIKSFQVGKKVRLQGLSSSHYNGAEGVVVDSEKSGRVTVKLMGATTRVLQQHPNGIRVKWQNIEWISKRPMSSITMHYTMNADDDTGRTLTLPESEEKLRNMTEAMLLANKERWSGKCPLIFMYTSDFRTNTDHMSQSEAREFLQKHIGKLRNAYQLFFGYGPPVNAIDSECLSLYEALFTDMHHHKSVWMVFFENIKNTVWCERSVAMFTHYAAILRQRAECFRESNDDKAFETLSHCEKVLNLGGRLIKRYKDSLIHPDFLEVVCLNNAGGFYLDQKCAELLTYRYLLVKHNLLLQTGRGHNINLSEVRFMCEIELDPTSGASDNILGQSGNRLAVLMDFLKRPCTRRAFAVTTDAEIATAYKWIAKRATKDSNYGAETTIPNRMCGCCGFFEEPHAKMKRCSRCLIEFYCSAECQRIAWPEHQAVCNPPEAHAAETRRQ